MKKVLCFGDSNTFGYIPASGKRYDKNTRWCGVLQNLAGNKLAITEAGCNNRTAFCDNPDGEMFTGYKILPKLLQEKYDYVILAIGINDLQPIYGVSTDEVKSGIEKLIGIVRTNCPESEIVLIAPACINENILKSGFSFLFDETSITKSHQIGEIYNKIAKTEGCKFIDLEKFTTVSMYDGLHYEAEQHKLIAETIWREIFA